MNCDEFIEKLDSSDLIFKYWNDLPEGMNRKDVVAKRIREAFVAGQMNPLPQAGPIEKYEPTQLY